MHTRFYKAFCTCDFGCNPHFFTRSLCGKINNCRRATIICAVRVETRLMRYHVNKIINQRMATWRKKNVWFILRGKILIVSVFNKKSVFVIFRSRSPASRRFQCWRDTCLGWSCLCKNNGTDISGLNKNFKKTCLIIRIFKNTITTYNND